MAEGIKMRNACLFRVHEEGADGGDWLACGQLIACLKTVELCTHYLAISTGTELAPFQP